MLLSYGVHDGRKDEKIDQAVFVEKKEMIIWNGGKISAMIVIGLFVL